MVLSVESTLVCMHAPASVLPGLAVCAHTGSQAGGCPHTAPACADPGRQKGTDEGIMHVYVRM